jgi:glyoxylase-like metal-dependent hydrolase (beta-lactamase superfamily II)
MTWNHKHSLDTWVEAIYYTLMKRIVFGFLFASLGLACALLWMHWPARVAVAALQEGIQLPDARPPEGMSLELIDTGVMASKAGLAYRGGNLLEERDFAMVAYLVKHPQGDLLIDAGLGANARKVLEQQSVLMRSTSTLVQSSSLGKRLASAGYAAERLAGVLLTHSHWDHVSGLEDLPRVPVWVTNRELREGDAASEFLQRFALREYTFEHGPYLGYAVSRDMWGDGSVVVVPAPGHTSDSVVVFVNLPSKQRFVFVGDIVWQTEGLELPAERPLLARHLVDEDDSAVRNQIGHLAALHQRFPALTFVPAHDTRSVAQLPCLGGAGPNCAMR